MSTHSLLSSLRNVILATSFFISFVRMKQALCLCLTTPTRCTFFVFFLQVLRQAGPPQRVDCWAEFEINESVFPKDTLPVQESNQELVTLRLLVRRSTTELSQYGIIFYRIILLFVSLFDIQN